MANKSYQLFSICGRKRKTRLENGTIETHGTAPINPLDIVNHDIYDESWKLIEKGTQQEYESEFFIRIINMNPIEILGFLKHHYERCTDKDLLLKHIKYNILHSKLLSKGQLSSIDDWYNNKIANRNWKIDPNNPLENFYLWSSLLQSYYASVFKSGHNKIKDLSEKLQINTENSITIVIYKAEREIEAQYLNQKSWQIIDKIIRPKFDYLIDFDKSLKKQYKMNHVDHLPKFIDYFHTTQIGLWDFYDWYRHLVGEIDLNNIDKQPHPPKIELKDFFKDHIEKDKISKIQTSYKGVRGKEMAILIYLLQSDFEAVEMYAKSKTKSRSHFVKCLTGSQKIAMQGINKYFISATDDIKISNEDSELNALKTELNALLN